MKPVIETHALCKSYHGRLVVDHLNLTVPEGCVYGFLGPNGAGKSTTMKMLLGLVHPTGGSVELLGHTLNKANRIVLLRQTGSLIESPSGYLHLTARENLSIVADLKDVDRKDISRVLEIVHLTKDADRKVGQYSLGMKQRLGIAMALLGSPKLLILDEPTNGLDPAGIQEMRSLIASMPQTTGATVLISSHLLGEIEQMVDQVGILNHGRLLFEGSLQQLQKHSRGGILLRVLDAPKAAAVLQQQGVKAAAPADQPDTLQLPPLPDEALAVDAMLFFGEFLLMLWVGNPLPALCVGIVGALVGLFSAFMPPLASYFVPFGYYIPLSAYEVANWDKATHTVTYGTRPFNWVLLAFTLALGAVLFALAWRKVQDEEV